jgi:tetratricopeptide (TPR) repeat protein
MVRIAHVTLFTCLALLLAAAPAAADDDGLALAESHFNKEQSLYQDGKYEEAADEFKAAYNARALPPFLFNIGAAYEKLAKADPGKLDHWKKAVEYYERYLKEEPKADDRKAIKKRIKVLKGELARLEKAIEKNAAPETVKTSDKVDKLEEVAIRGLVVIESEPAGANIYLDDKKKGPVSKTPWSGTLEGEHTIFIEKKGYRQYEMNIAPSPDRLVVLKVALAEEDYLGWVEIKSNVPGADVYIDEKSVGVYTRTPFSGNLKPGSHKIWVTAEGYDEFATELEVVAGETHSVSATLKGSPVGYLAVSGAGIENSAVYLDGKVLCKTGPCRMPVTQGKHRVTIKRSGYKPYTRTVTVQPKTEQALKVDLAKKPGRSDAVWAYIFSATFAAGGVFASLQSKSIYDELNDEIAAASPPPDSEDPRFTRGKLWTAGADVAYGLAGITLLTAMYYTFRDKGPASKGALDVRAVALEPHIAPGYAGIGMEVSW